MTKPGLDQPVGNAAINHVPRQMIRENVEEIQKKLDDFRALQVIISVPEGEELAKHTFNPRLGITGGISILGTSGIVVPMSEEALISTIRVEMEMRKAQGDRVLLVTPGNYGQDFLKTYPWSVQTIPLSAVITSEKHWNLQLSSALTPSFLWHILENLSRCPAEL